MLPITGESPISEGARLFARKLALAASAATLRPRRPAGRRQRHRRLQRGREASWQGGYTVSGGPGRPEPAGPPAAARQMRVGNGNGKGLENAA